MINLLTPKIKIVPLHFERRISTSVHGIRRRNYKLMGWDEIGLLDKISGLL
jgi:hypothetical protein